MERSTERKAAWIALGLLSLIWGYNWIVMKQAMELAGPFDFSALRYTLGTVVLFVLLVVRRESLRPPPLAPTVLIGLAQVMGFQALVQWALVDGAAGKTSLLAYSMPFWVVLLNWLLFRRRLEPAHVGGVALAGAGLVLVLEPWLGLGGKLPIALALASGFCWAFGTVLAKRQFETTQVSLFSLTAWQMLFGTLGLIAIALVVDQRPIAWTPYFWFAVLYNGLLSSGLAWLLWLLVVERLPAHIAGLSSLVIPVLAMVLAFVLLGERPTVAEYAGMAAILLALAFLNRQGKKVVPAE